MPGIWRAAPAAKAAAAAVLAEIHLEDDADRPVKGYSGGMRRRLDLGAAHEGIRREDIIRNVDRRVRRDDTLQADMVSWLGGALDGVLAKGVELTQVARHVNAFADACARKIGMLWKENRAGTFHRNLFSETARPSLSEHYRFTFDPALYPARCSFGGRWTFRKHFYPLPGELDDDVRAEDAQQPAGRPSLHRGELVEIHAGVEPGHRAEAARLQELFFPGLIPFHPDGADRSAPVLQAVALDEALDPTLGVDDLLRAREERVALVAQFHDEVAAPGGARGEVVAARATN